ncbi:hypothetical protein QNI23_017110 (plasmid) [Bermanella sp. WJH001]|uniref:hypothetical protein n=1 Tax=Bermanella sp. WJH001 TaxID=3048005 RepID=UPI0024BEF6E6|nr:hypothetical protein [Bermanella sp. WJH001]MDJ1539470.1 hypothetical protein [Bermanella sp. WJH001]
MNARTRAKQAPLINTTLASVAFFIHVLLCVINFNFSAYINEIPLHQSNVNTLIFAVIQPVFVACLVAPVLCIARHTDFMTEFKNILFIAISLFVVYSLADMSGIIN